MSSLLDTSVLRVENLRKSFGAIQVTDSVYFDVQPGEIHALIGPNGAGKTTLIGQIAGEIRPDSGQIGFSGQDITTWPVARRARAGMSRSYQISSAITDFTVLENVLLAVQARHGHNFHFFARALDQQTFVDEAYTHLDKVGLTAHANTPVQELAYGQRRLVEIATALAAQPKLLLLDEPMAGLGPAETQQMIRLFDGLREDCAMLLVEHDMSAVFALADRISVLVYGRILLTDEPAIVKSDPTVIQAYLGEEDIA